MTGTEVVSGMDLGGGDKGPLVIAGTGGSGTRLLALLCNQLGYRWPRRLNHALDALDFFPFHERWLSDFLGQRLSELQLQQMRRELCAIVALLEAELGESRPGRWGWKAPRNLLLLPLLDECVPNLRFIHLVRDGRDMAFSTNQNQCQKHGDVVLDAQESTLPTYLRSIAFWRHTNLAVAAYGATRMSGRYLSLCYEDLLVWEVGAIASLAHFLDLSVEDLVPLKSQARPNPGVGRWRQQPADLQARLTAMGQPALNFFGYT